MDYTEYENSYYSDAPGINLEYCKKVLQTSYTPASPQFNWPYKAAVEPYFTTPASFKWLHRAGSV